MMAAENLVSIVMPSETRANLLKTSPIDSCNEPQASGYRSRGVSSSAFLKAVAALSKSLAAKNDWP